MLACGTLHDVWLLSASGRPRMLLQVMCLPLHNSYLLLPIMTHNTRLGTDHLRPVTT
jgi:hypothetical protein